MSPICCNASPGYCTSHSPTSDAALAFLLPQAKDPASGKVYIVAKARFEALPGAVPKKKAGGKKKGGEEEAAPAGFEVLATYKGADLVSERGGGCLCLGG